MSAEADDGEPDRSVRARRFDAMYEERIDPWGFRTSSYERDKYRATLNALPRSRYHRALEIGCSIGELSRVLRERADEVLGLDVSAVAIAEARRAHREVSSLCFQIGEVPLAWPDGPRDLIVLSEVLYFLGPDEIDALAHRVAGSLEPGGHCVTVCWLGDTDAGTDLDGDEASARFTTAVCSVSGIDISVVEAACQRETSYRLDVFERSID